MRKGIRIYNLYPKLVGSMEKWIENFDRIKEMNFDWIYVNPFNAPGFSGSDYAIKDYYLYHPLFVTGKMDFSDLESQRLEGDRLIKKVCDEAKSRGMNIMMDLVINHTAVDCQLTKTKPEWYMKKKDGSIKNPGAMDGDQWIEWGDLAQIDNENSSDKEGLWDYWLDMIIYYADLGIRGFRCDAAYHVPNKLWSFLISLVKSKYPDVIFIAETLGCQPSELMETADTGFDIVMNSFKWWDLKEDYFLRDYKDWAGKYPSLTFPENHDTIRYAQETNGNQNMAVMKYALGAYFSSSIATTLGFEYGFRRKIDVVKTTPDWMEKENYNISKEIAEINKTKATYNILQEDNMIEMYHFENENISGFTKKSLDGKEKIFVIANKDAHNSQTVFINNIRYVMENEIVKDISHGHKMNEITNDLEYRLNPGEVKLFYSKK